MEQPSVLSAAYVISAELGNDVNLQDLRNSDWNIYILNISCRYVSDYMVYTNSLGQT